MTKRALLFFSGLALTACDDGVGDSVDETSSTPDTIEDTSVSDVSPETSGEDTTVAETDDDTTVAETSDDTTVAETRDDTSADTRPDGDTSEPVDPTGLIGEVQIELYPPLPEVEQVGWNQFGVALYDGPLAVFHEPVLTVGDCTRYNRTIADCQPACADTEICQGDGACVAIRNAAFAGTVTWTNAAEAMVSLAPNTDNPDYHYYPSEERPPSWFGSGESIRVTGTGDDVPAFDVNVLGVAPLTADKEAEPFEYLSEYPEDVHFVWHPATPGTVVEVALRVGHHVAPPSAEILCSAPDGQGHITVAKELLVGMGFCTGPCLFQHPSDITRIARTLVATPKGPFEVVVKTRGRLSTAAPD